MNQRWLDRIASYRAPHECINPRAFEVSDLGDRAAKAFVLQHHYAATYPAARYRFGLHRGGALVGVAVFSHPTSNAVLTSVFPGTATDSVGLGRFVLLDSVEGNGESWFLARCFEQLKAIGLRGVVSFSDPVPRLDAAGRTVFRGHLGTIYQASNGVYLGRATPRTLHLLPSGAVFSARAAQKIRAGERGWIYAAAQLQAHGAPRCPTDDTARRDWLRTWTRTLTASLRHPGNHRYAWPLDRYSPPQGTRQPYPKHPLA